MKKIDNFTNLQTARKITGRSYLDLILEIIKLRLSTGKIGISEYFDYRLFDDDISFEKKLEFCGYRGQAILEDILVDDYSKILSLDKLTFHHIMKSYGFSVPGLKALYTETGRPFSGKRITNQNKLINYLRNDTIYPIYLKPSFGAYGSTNTQITGIENDSLILGDNSKKNIYDFCKQIKDPSGFGLLIQETLKPHSKIVNLCGEKISGLRVHPFLGNDGLYIHRVLWKINVGTNDTDNFSSGLTGNMLADVDLNTGRITRVVSGIGLNQKEVQQHPTTGETLVGFELPWFNEAIQLVKDAAILFPGFICQGWDIAICEDGPVAIEVNWFGDVELPQYSGRHGFLDQKFLSLMKSRNLDKYLKGRARPCHMNPTGRLGWRGSHWPY